MVDATMGHGGHSFLFGQRLGPAGTLVGLDVDSNSLERARQRLAGLGCRVVLIRSNFSRLAERLGEFGIKEVHFVLADLGLCSAQLVDRERGLSFRADMPLDMRIDASLETTAADIVNSLDEKSLADLIYRFGQDRASRRIARYIVRRRQREPIATTGQLAQIVAAALTPAPGGYLAVISFHSLEDGTVKRDFKQNERDGLYRLVTKKPITASREEIAANHRARSAKLRIAQKN